METLLPNTKHIFVYCNFLLTYWLTYMPIHIKSTEIIKFLYKLSTQCIFIIYTQWQSDPSYQVSSRMIPTRLRNPNKHMH